MSIRAKMLELSKTCGIDAGTLRRRWAKGLRGDALIDPRKTLHANRKPQQPRRSSIPALPVNVPQSLRYR